VFAVTGVVRLTGGPAHIFAIDGAAGIVAGTDLRSRLGSGDPVPVAFGGRGIGIAVHAEGRVDLAVPVGRADPDVLRVDVALDEVVFGPAGDGRAVAARGGEDRTGSDIARIAAADDATRGH